MVLDSGIQLDAGDLSDTRTSPGWTGTAPIVDHRKVLRYEPTSIYTLGGGDLLGCDDPINGGFTHGHFASITALGNGTAVDPVRRLNPP